MLQFVMDNPSDRVTYGDLRLIKSEFEELMQLSIAAGTIKRHARTKITSTRALSETSRRLASRSDGRRSALNRGSWRRSPAARSCAHRRRRGAAPSSRSGVFKPARLAPDFSLQGPTAPSSSSAATGARLLRWASATPPAPMSVRRRSLPRRGQEEAGCAARISRSSTSPSIPKETARERLRKYLAAL